jgi:hypothetical protein
VISKFDEGFSRLHEHVFKSKLLFDWEFRKRWI